MYRLLLVSGLLVLLYYLRRRAIRKMKEDGGAVSLQEEQVAGNQMIQDAARPLSELIAVNASNLPPLPIPAIAGSLELLANDPQTTPN